MKTRTIQAVAEGLWTVEDDLFMAGRSMHFPLRMTIVRQPDGGLLLISPVAMDDALAHGISGLGPVRDILAPNGFHHLHATSAARRYPKAQLHLAPCLLDKVPALSSSGGRRWTEAPTSWAPELTAHVVQGLPKLDEVVVLHRPSRTLIVTDLVFNIHQTKGWMMAPVLRISGAYRRLAQSRLLRSMVKDEDATRQSLRAVLEWDFDRLIMAHGMIVQQGAHAQLSQALSWLIPYAPVSGRQGT